MQLSSMKHAGGSMGFHLPAFAPAMDARAVVLLVLFLAFLPVLGAARQVLLQEQPQISKPQVIPCSSCRASAEDLREQAASLVRKETLAALKRAEAYLKKSAGLFEEAQSYPDAAQNYITIGEIYTIWSRYEDALDMYEKALNRIEASDIELRCSILSHQALAYDDLGNDSKAIEVSMEARKLAESTSNPNCKARVFEAFAAASLTNHPKDALKAASLAVELYKSVNDLDGEARALLISGLACFHDNARLDDAFAAYKQALDRWSQAHNRHGMALAERAMGQVLALKGGPQAAIKKYNDARRSFRSVGDLDNEGVALNGLGDVSREIGKYDQSLRYFTEARSIFSRAKDRGGELGALGGAAQAAWALRQWDRALELNTTRLRRAREVGHTRFEAAAWSGLGDLSVNQGNYRKAEYMYLKALFLYRSVGHSLGEADVLLRLGHLYSEQARNEVALPYLYQALDLAQTIERTSQIARAHFEIAAVYLRQHRWEEAKDEIESTLKIIESQRTKIFDFDDRASYFSSVHEYYQLDIDILMQLHRQRPGGDYARQALEAAEKSKVRSLLDMLGAGSAPSPLTLKEIQAEIRGDHVVLLEYALGRERSYLWIITQAGMRSHEISLSTKAMREIEKRFRDSLVAPGIHFREETGQQERIRNEEAYASYRRDRQQLAGALLGPALSSLQRKTLIVVPDGFLQYVPFATLLPDETPDLATLPSASALKALRKSGKNRRPPAGAVAVFANGVFNKDDERLPHTSASLPRTNHSSEAFRVERGISGSPYIPSLPASRKEGEAIGHTYSNEKALVIQGFEATREAAVRVISLYRIIHFATHALLDTQWPARSGLVFSMFSKDGQPLDGYLRLKDIYRLKLSSDLVVLSACQSALGKDLESEGMIGLTRAFLYAGSRRVISTLWKVDDEAVAEFMTYFYRRFHQGESPSLALRGAQKDLVTNNPKWNRPYYWAAFVLQGEYRRIGRP